jgi:hypothetical protein
MTIHCQYNLFLNGPNYKIQYDIALLKKEWWPVLQFKLIVGVSIGDKGRSEASPNSR